MSRGIILPSLPPLADNYLVSVCAACKFRFCVLGCKPCAARREKPSLGWLSLTVAELRASGSQEHHSYWRCEPGDDLDMPKSVEDVAELAAHDRDRAVNKPDPRWTLEERASLFAGYLTEQLGLNPEQCRDAIRTAYPEAAAAIDKYLVDLAAARATGGAS